MESSTEGRLGLKKIPLVKWKGKTFSQISSVLQKNKNTLSSDTPVHMLLRPMPMKHYRREIATILPSSSNPRKSQSIYLDMETPGGAVLQSASSECTGIQRDIEVPLEGSLGARPCNSCDDTLVSNRPEYQNSKYIQSLSAADNARRRVRSSGMNRPRYDNTKNNRPESYGSASQYLHGRNKTFKQNQFNSLRIENAANSAENVYASNTIQYCGNGSSMTEYVPVYYKPNNEKFGVQGAVDSSSRLARLKYDTITDAGSKMRDAYGAETANALSYGVPANGYTIKDKVGYPNICTPVIKKDGTLVKC